jgi:DNA-binding NarL/FixJ family response regulator
MNFPLTTVAIIDDNEIYRVLMTRMFNSSGMNVVFQAGDGKVGIEQMQASLVLPMVVIIDIEMPVMNGFETACHIKMNWPQVAIIGHSSLIEDSARDMMIEAGADIFLTKSCGIKQLISSVEQLAKLKF